MATILKVRNHWFESYITNLFPVYHALWKTTKNFKDLLNLNYEKTWQKLDFGMAYFAKHLAIVINAHENNNNDAENEEYLNAS